MDTIYTIIGISISAIGLLYAIRTYKKQFKPDEELENLKIQFKANQTLSLQVQTELKQFADENNAWQNYFMPGVTCKTYLETMQDFYKTELTDEQFKKIESLNLTKSNIVSMTRQLENQFDALSQVRTAIKLMVKQ